MAEPPDNSRGDDANQHATTQQRCRGATRRARNSCSTVGETSNESTYRLCPSIRVGTTACLLSEPTANASPKRRNPESFTDTSRSSSCPKLNTTMRSSSQDSNGSVISTVILTEIYIQRSIGKPRSQTDRKQGSGAFARNRWSGRLPQGPTTAHSHRLFGNARTPRHSLWRMTARTAKMSPSLTFDK
ncbi:hypothetical protein SV7mr_48360 [Stieleria bergensis]|uniref:Uncharacterized protein n=1 Tax=Stieleria bergensis TaxID=2528025 RepID=A0A517T1N9_9BACT|nr:hypothetical protein SV7mr_48360 [Planctomycetes bacterium SV_7m_r]